MGAGERSKRPMGRVLQIQGVPPASGAANVGVQGAAKGGPIKVKGPHDGPFGLNSSHEVERFQWTHICRVEKLINEIHVGAAQYFVFFQVLHC